MNNKTPSSILIVDDNSKNLQILAEILRNEGYRVAMAKNGVSALNFAHKKEPDLILLDIMMPEMNGFQVCRRLKDDSGTKEIPVIFISALAETEDKLKGFDAGGVDYIAKPFQKEEILARVDAHLRLRNAREELKKANERLKTATETKDRLFSIIAHDLRGSMSLLSTELEMMSENPNMFANEDEKRECMEELSMTAKGTSELLENLLSWARCQRGDINCQPRNVDLAWIVEANTDNLSGIAKGKSIWLHSDVRADTIVYADADMIMTVVRNLISNALKFTEELGEVRITASVFDEVVEVSVTDNGVGFDQVQLKALFSLDERHTAYGTRNEKGSGLGLMICKDFVERNGGKIWAENRKEKGSIFRFTLPRGTAGRIPETDFQGDFK